MKSFIIILLIACGIGIAGTIIYLNRSKTLPPAPVVESSPVETSVQTEMEEEKIATPKPEVPQTISTVASEPVKVPAPTPGTSETKPDDSTNAIHKAVDDLLSAKNGAEKQAAFQQLAKSGQLDAAIAELKQRAANDPNNPQLPTTLGEAQLNKLRAISAAGGDRNDIAILAMEADKSFNAALKIDPQNWEAQFVKAASMYYWPANEERDNDVVQRLSSLIDQQETKPSQPEFAQSYLVLGNQYKKIGQPEKALATWQLGLNKFPTDPALLKKIAAQP